MSIAMWQEMQDLKSRLEALEQRVLSMYRAPEMEELRAKLDKFEKLLNKYTAPKRS